MDQIQEFKSSDYDLVGETISGLWNLWECHREGCKRIAGFLIQILESPVTHSLPRVSLIADFARLGQRGLKALFESFGGRNGKGFEILAREDLDFFFVTLQCPLTSHYDPEGFYGADEREASRECSRDENKTVVCSEGIRVREVRQ
jgi:hypothetical protein